MEPSRIGLSPAENALESADQIEALYAVGYVLFDSGRADQAVDFFRLLVMMRCDEPRYWVALGRSLEAIGQEQSASAVYEIGAANCERRVACHLAAVALAMRCGRSDDARASLALARDAVVDDDDASLVFRAELSLKEAS